MGQLPLSNLDSLDQMLAPVEWPEVRKILLCTLHKSRLLGILVYTELFLQGLNLEA